MRLNRQQIERLAFKLVKGLLSENMILTDDKEKMVTEIEAVITKELEKEDLLVSISFLKLILIAFPFRFLLVQE